MPRPLTAAGGRAAQSTVPVLRRPEGTLTGFVPFAIGLGLIAPDSETVSSDPTAAAARFRDNMSRLGV